MRKTKIICTLGPSTDKGADTLRLYEMFLGPVEASKPWDTNGAQHAPSPKHDELA